MSLEQNNSKEEKISINTRGLAFYNKDGFDPSTLGLGFWNDNFITIKINPTLPKDKQTPTRIYDYEKTVQTALTVPAARLFSECIKTKIIPAIAKGEEHSVSIQVGGDSLVSVGTGKRITGDVRPYLAIHKGLNPSTRKAEMSIFYEFNTSNMIENYNETNGEYKLSSNYNTELQLFIDFLDAGVKALTKADVHAMRVVMRAFNDKLMNNVVASAEKLGVATSKSYGSSNRIDFSQSPSSDEENEFTAMSSMIGSLADLD